jgi:hypothetical protein
MTQFSLREVAIIEPDDGAFVEFENDMKAETALNLVLRFGYLVEREAD